MTISSPLSLAASSTLQTACIRGMVAKIGLVMAFSIARPRRHTRSGRHGDQVDKSIVSLLSAGAAMQGLSERAYAAQAGLSRGAIQKRSEEHTSELQSLMR